MGPRLRDLLGFFGYPYAGVCMAIPRRTFLKLGLGGVGLLALGGAGLALQSTTLVEPQGPLRCLNVRQYSILYAVADAIVSPSEDMPSVGDLGAVETMDGLLAQLHPDDMGQILQVLSLLENALTGLLLDGRVQTFTSYSRTRRVEILDGWRTSRIGTKQQAFVALHGLCVASYWGNPKAYAFTGYPGPPDFTGLLPQPEVADG